VSLALIVAWIFAVAGGTAVIWSMLLPMDSLNYRLWMCGGFWFMGIAATIVGDTPELMKVIVFSILSMVLCIYYLDHPDMRSQNSPPNDPNV